MAAQTVSSPGPSCVGGHGKEVKLDIYIFLVDIGSHFGFKDIIVRVAHTPAIHLICVY